MFLQLEADNFGYVLIGISAISVAFYAAIYFYNKNNFEKKNRARKRLFSRLNNAANEIDRKTNKGR